MPGKVHTHKGKRVYHRKGGALRFHSRDHSRYMLSLDRKRRAKTVLKGKRRKYYPHSGDSEGKRI